MLKIYNDSPQFIIDNVMELQTVFGNDKDIDISFCNDRVEFWIYVDNKSSNTIKRKYKSTFTETLQDIQKWIVKAEIKMQNNEDANTYINLSEYIKPIIGRLGNVYATSYGIGIEVFFNAKIDAIKAVEVYLNNNGIEYKNEYSLGGYVYRFKISKSKENINKINNLKS